MRPTPTGPIGWLHLCYCSYSGVYYRTITTGIIGGATEVVLQSSYVPMGWWSMGVVECGEVPMTLIYKIVHFHFYLSLVFSQSFILIIGTHSHMIPWHAEIPVLIQWYFIEMCKKPKKQNVHWAKLIHRHCCLTRRQVATIMVMTGSINDTWHLYWLHVLGMKTGRIHYLQWHSQDLEVGVTGCLGDRSLQAWSRGRWSPWRLTAYYGYLAAKLCTFLCIKPNCMSRWYTRWSCTPPHTEADWDCRRSPEFRHNYLPQCLAKMSWYLQPTPNFFSSDFGSSRDPAGLGLGGTWPFPPPRGYATDCLRGIGHMSPKQRPFPFDDMDHTHGSLSQHESALKPHLDRFVRFCKARRCDHQTCIQTVRHAQTDHSVAVGVFSCYTCECDAD